MGTYGPDAGHVCIFKQSKDRWAQTADFMGLDSNEKDRFGHAVSLSMHGQRAIIGAPGADDYAPQVYDIYCNAVIGSFYLAWGNTSFGPISYASSQLTFLNVLRHAKSTIIDFPTIRLDGWNIATDGDGICQGRSFNLVIHPKPNDDDGETPILRLTAANSTISGTLSVTASSTPQVSLLQTNVIL